MDLNEFERSILSAYLKGDFVSFATLREQFEQASVKSREYTPAGFFADLSVPPDAPKLLLADSQMGDVHIRIPSLALGMGTVLFITDGYLDLLEGFTYGEDWDCRTEGFSIEYREARRYRDENGIPAVFRESRPQA